MGNKKMGLSGQNDTSSGLREKRYKERRKRSKIASSGTKNDW